MTEDSPTGKGAKKRYWLKNMFVISRFLVVIAIIGLLIGSIVVIIAGIGQLFRIGSYPTRLISSSNSIPFRSYSLLPLSLLFRKGRRSLWEERPSRG
jgi:hypothetical protein